VAYSFTPSGSSGEADRVAVANRMADVMGPNVPGHPYGISSGSGDPAVILQQSGGFMEALCDTVLASSGFQTANNLPGALDHTALTTLADAPFSVWTFNAPIAKTYVTHVDFGCFGNGPGGFLLRLVVNGTTGPTIQAYMPVANYIVPFHLMLAAPCAAGANVISVQWAIVDADLIEGNSNCFANYIVTG
jgi:hypothetical protein